MCPLCGHECPGVSPSLVQRLSGQYSPPPSRTLSGGTRSASAPNLLIPDNTTPLPVEAETGRRSGSGHSVAIPGAVAASMEVEEEQLNLKGAEEGSVSQQDAGDMRRNLSLGGQVGGSVGQFDSLFGSERHIISVVTRHRSLPRRSLEPVAEDVPWTSDTAVVQSTAGRKRSWGGEVDKLQLPSEPEIQPADVPETTQSLSVPTQTGRAMVTATGSDSSASNPPPSSTIQHLRRLPTPLSSSNSQGAAPLSSGSRDRGSASPRTPATRATLVIPDFVWETYIPDTVDVHAAGRHHMHAVEPDNIRDLMNPWPTPAGRRTDAKRVTVTCAGEATSGGAGTEAGMGGHAVLVHKMVLVPSTMELFKEQMSDIFCIRVDKVLGDGYAEVDSVDVIRDGDKLLIVPTGFTSPGKLY